MLTRSRHAVVPASGPLADDGNQGGVRAAVPHARVLRRGTSLCVVDSPLTQALRVHRITTRIWAQNEELRDRAKKWRSAKHKKYGVRQERVSRVFFDHMDRDRDGYWVECVGPCALGGGDRSCYSLVCAAFRLDIVFMAAYFNFKCTRDEVLCGAASTPTEHPVPHLHTSCGDADY